MDAQRVQMPISRQADFRPQSGPGGNRNLPAPQSMHAAELDAPVAELYVPAEGRGWGARHSPRGRPEAQRESEGQ